MTTTPRPRVALSAGQYLLRLAECLATVSCTILGGGAFGVLAARWIFGLTLEAVLRAPNGASPDIPATITLAVGFSFGVALAVDPFLATFPRRRRGPAKLPREKA